MTDGDAASPSKKRKRRRRRYRRRLCSAEERLACLLIGGGASAAEVAEEIDGVTPSSIRAAARRWGARFVEKKAGQDSLVAVMSKRAAHDLSVLAEGREMSEAALLGLIVETLMDDRELYRAVMEKARGKAA